MSHQQLEWTPAGTARGELSDAELQAFRDLGREIGAGIDATIARYLAAGDGWQEAGNALRGAFAPVRRHHSQQASNSSD